MILISLRQTRPLWFTFWEIVLIAVVVKDFLTDNQIDVILGPYDDATGIVADKLRVPYICTTGSKRNLNYTFQILPPLEDFSQAIFDMTKSYQWDKVSLFYDDLRGKFLFKK